MDTQGKDAFDIRALRKNISEGTRLLYVAMTRAQQKLCLVGSVKDGEETLWSNQTRAARIWKTRSMLDMIMPAVLQRVDLPEVGETAEDDLWRVACVSGKAIEEGTEEERTSTYEIEEMRTLGRNMAFMMKSIQLGKAQFGLPQKETPIFTSFHR